MRQLHESKSREHKLPVQSIDQLITRQFIVLLSCSIFSQIRTFARLSAITGKWPITSADGQLAPSCSRTLPFDDHQTDTTFFSQTPSPSSLHFTSVNVHGLTLFVRALLSDSLLLSLRCITAFSSSFCGLSALAIRSQPTAMKQLHKPRPSASV
jgi:hypothetical protein